jgi:hypothetical protein
MFQSELLLGPPQETWCRKVTAYLDHQGAHSGWGWRMGEGLDLADQSARSCISLLSLKPAMAHDLDEQQSSFIFYTNLPGIAPSGAAIM